MVFFNCHRIQWFFGRTQRIDSVGFDGGWGNVCKKREMLLLMNDESYLLVMIVNFE